MSSDIVVRHASRTNLVLGYVSVHQPYLNMYYILYVIEAHVAKTLDQMCIKVHK
jgi:hypothetical protein